MVIVGVFVGLQALLVGLAAIGAPAIVVQDAVIDLWNRGEHTWSVMAAVGFPITFVVWPWTHEAWGFPLWIVFIIGSVCFGALKSRYEYG